MKYDEQDYLVEKLAGRLQQSILVSHYETTSKWFFFKKTVRIDKFVPVIHGSIWEYYNFDGRKMLAYSYDSIINQIPEEHKREETYQEWRERKRKETE